MKIVCSPFCRAFWGEARGVFKNRRIMIIGAVLTALLCVAYVFVTVEGSVLGTTQRISAAFLISGATAMICGPFYALPVGILVDTITFLIRPSGMYMPVYALIWVIRLLLYALFLFRQKPTLLRVSLCSLSVTLICNAFLDTLISYLYFAQSRSGFFVFFIARLPKNLLMLPVEIAALWLFLRAVSGPLASLKVIPAIPWKKKHTNKP